MRRSNTPPHLLTLILLTALALSSLNMFLPALALIAEELGADYGTMSLAVGGYLAVTAGVQLMTGALADRFGRRPVLLLALGAFSAASAGCAAAQDAATFLVFRAIQAAVVTGSVLVLVIVRDTSEGAAAARRLSLISAAMSLSPMLGPVLGGVFADAFGWRSIFWLYASFGCALLMLSHLDVGETRAAAPRRLRKGYRPLLGSWNYLGFAFCTAFSTGAFFVFLAGAPLVASAAFGLSSSALGIVIGSITVGFMIGSIGSSRAAGRYSARTLIVAGRMIACAGLAAGLTLWSAGLDSHLIYFAATICAGLGNGLTMPSSNAGVVSVRPDLAATAAGLSGALTVGIGSLLTVIAGMVLTEANAASALLSLMLGASAISLLAAISIR